MARRVTEERGLVRYWIAFADDALPPPLPGAIWLDAPPGPKQVGVTAFDQADALDLVRERWWPEQSMPTVEAILEDVDVSAMPLDSRLLGVPIWRGIWYPVATL